MGKPTIYQRLRQGLGKAFRETGQALDRVGIKGHSMAVTQRVIGDDPVLYQDHLSRHRQQMPLLRRGKPMVSPDVAFLAPCATLIGTVHVGAGSSVFYKSILRADNCDNAEAFNNDNSDSRVAIGDSSTTTTTTMSTLNKELVAVDEDGYSPEITSVRHPSEWDLDTERFQKTNSTATGGGIFIGEETNIQDGCIIDAKKDHTRIGNGVTVGHLVSIHSATIEDHCLIGMGSLLQEGVVVGTETLIAAGCNIPKNTKVGSGELWVGSPARKLRDLTPNERQRLHFQADQYVGVASALSDGMVLGGNLPESLEQYMSYGHDAEDEDYNDEDKAKAEA
mmetsp:Transcript_9509/g.23667  ORF Transcript_9509/g.23667 Transcript_9509/m.23667 type:complete len:336 (+) Transcript_9509:200-1207(+)